MLIRKKFVVKIGERERESEKPEFIFSATLAYSEGADGVCQAITNVLPNNHPKKSQTLDFGQH